MLQKLFAMINATQQLHNKFEYRRKKERKIIDYGNEHFSDEFVSIFKICKLKNIEHIKMGSMIKILRI